MTWVLGLTGGIGSGKTAASDYFAGKCIRVVDADVVAREVVEPNEPAWRAIREHFGEQALGLWQILLHFFCKIRQGQGSRVVKIAPKKGNEINATWGGDHAKS